MKYIGDQAVDHLKRMMDVPDFSSTRYRLIEEIGRGGMGAVYLAEDTVLGRDVALKVLNEPDLAGEARVTARLEHPGIVPVHDAGALPDGRVFYAMKSVQGRLLRDYQAPLAEKLRVFQKVCESVAFAHSQGVIHRDLKPENIMVGAFGEVLVLDWGVAATGPDGNIAGTAKYMAPEQALGRTADARTDIYALGAVLGDLMHASQVRRPLESIRLKAMAGEPEARYPDALELRADIGRYLDGEPVSAHRETLMERIGRVSSRHSMLILLVAAYLVMRTALLLFTGR